MTGRRAINLGTGRSEREPPSLTFTVDPKTLSLTIANGARFGVLKLEIVATQITGGPGVLAIKSDGRTMDFTIERPEAPDLMR